MNHAHYTKSRRMIGYSILALIYMSFTCWWLAGLQAITDVSFTLHELMYVPMSLLFILGPILFLMYSYYVAKTIRHNVRWFSGKSVLIAFSLLFIGCSFSLQQRNVYISGIYEEVDKLKQDGRYYIMLEDRKIQVTESDYALVDEGASYLLSYDWHPKRQKGELDYIERIETEDMQ